MPLEAVVSVFRFWVSVYITQQQKRQHRAFNTASPAIDKWQTAVYYIFRVKKPIDKITPV